MRATKRITVFIVPPIDTERVRSRNGADITTRLDKMSRDSSEKCFPAFFARIVPLCCGIGGPTMHLGSEGHTIPCGCCLRRVIKSFPCRFLRHWPREHERRSKCRSSPDSGPEAALLLARDLLTRPRSGFPCRSQPGKLRQISYTNRLRLAYCVLPFALGVACVGVFLSRRVMASAALNGNWRTDCSPVVLRTTSTRRF